MEKQDMLSVQGLSFQYGKKEVLKEVSFRIREGKVTTILGQNGSGKSTLFHLMTKNLTYKTGAIHLHGKSIQRYSLREFARTVATVGQYNTALEEITVEQLVAYGRLPYYCTKESKEDQKYIDRAIMACNLEELRKEVVSNLSGGQMQRVWIALAIAQNTKVLFLDEPTTYLDVYHQLELLKMVRSFNEKYGMTIVMILHDINQALHYSDDIIALKDGKVAYEGDAKEFVTRENLQKIYRIELDMIEVKDRRYVLTV